MDYNFKIDGLQFELPEFDIRPMHLEYFDHHVRNGYGADAAS
jgi:hypothetical protein